MVGTAHPTGTSMPGIPDPAPTSCYLVSGNEVQAGLVEDEPYYDSWFQGRTCEVCRSLRPEFLGAPVHIHLAAAPPSKLVLDKIVLVPAAVLTAQLAEEVRLFDNPEVVKGDVLVRGRRLGKYLSATSRFVVPIRGGPESYRRACACGRVYYTPQPWESRHVYWRDWPSAHDVQLLGGQLLMLPSALERIGQTCRASLTVEELPVAEVAGDGMAAPLREQFY